jgi:N6-L-threonylcarbamoyladenine synthase
MMDSGDFDFSFSGLKTSVRIFLEKNQPPESDLPDICASFQAAVVDVLVAKLFRAARELGRDTISISGGVSANARLNTQAKERAQREGIRLQTAPAGLHTDNALMIAFAAAHRFQSGKFQPVASDIFPNFDPTGLMTA